MASNLVLVLPLLLAVVVMNPDAAAAGPRLFFTSDDLPALRQRCTEDGHREVWEDVLKRAEQYVTPESDFFADPQDVLAAVRDLRGSERYLKAGRWLTVWAEALGPAYYVMEDERFGRHGAALLSAMAEAMSLHGSGMIDADALARGEMMRGLGIAYDFFGHLLDDPRRQQVERVMADYIRHALAEAEDAWWFPNSNWTAVTIGGAGIAAAALQPRLPEAAQWVEQCRRKVIAWFDGAFDRYGAYVEGVDYIEYAMANVVLFADALARRGGDELFDHPHIRHIPLFLAMSLVPGTNMTEARNSAGYSPQFAGPWILRLAKVNQDPLARWLWEQRRPPRQDFPNTQLRHSATIGRSFFRILWANDVIPQHPADAGVPLTIDAFPRSRPGHLAHRVGQQRCDVLHRGRPLPPGRPSPGG